MSGLSVSKILPLPGDPRRIDALRARAAQIPAGKEREALKLKQSTQEFEALFVGQLMNKMRQTVFQSDYIDQGPAQDIFKDMYYRELAKEVSKAGGLGIAKLLYEQMVKQL